MNLRNMIIKIHICLIAFCFISGIKAQTQNSMTEIIPFKTIDGKIIIEVYEISYEGFVNLWAD